MAELSTSGIFLAIAVMSALAWHACVHRFAVAVAGAAVTSVGLAQVVLLHRISLDVMLTGVGVAIATTLAALVGIAMRAYRRRRGLGGAKPPAHAREGPHADGVPEPRLAAWLRGFFRFAGYALLSWFALLALAFVPGMPVALGNFIFKASYYALITVYMSLPVLGPAVIVGVIYLALSPRKPRAAGATPPVRTPSGSRPASRAPARTGPSGPA